MEGFDFEALFGGVWPFLALAVVFYFVLDRPHKKEQQRRKRMLENLKRGDKIVTVGGMYGVITRVSEKKVTIRLAENVEIEFLRTAISAYQDPAKQAEAEKK